VILDEEVFAVIMALTIVASVFAAAQILRPSVVEPFTAIGLLNEKGKIGDYPKKAVLGDNITFYIFVDNHMGKPIYYKVVYKIGINETLPTNTTPSPEPPVMEWKGVLNHEANATFKVQVPIKYPSEGEVNKITLIFELWTYDPDLNKWTYTGRWTHLHLEVVKP